MPKIKKPSDLQKRFVDCVKEVEKKDKSVNAFAVCQKSTGYRGKTRGLFGKKYDLPEPLDIHFESNDLVLRLVPDIDNLLELGVYVDPQTFEKINEYLDREGIIYDVVEKGYIARRVENKRLLTFSLLKVK